MNNDITIIDSNTLITINSNQEIINKWFKMSELTNKNTKQTYLEGLCKFVSFIKEKGIVNPTSETIIDFKEFLMNRYSNSSSYNYLSGVKSFYKFLELQNISQDITRGIKLPKIQRGNKKDSLTLDQLKSLFSILNQDTLLNARDCCIIQLMIRTGLRSCEVIGANIEDIQNKEGEKVLYIKGKGHTEKDNFVVIEPDLMNIIDNYLNKRKKYIDKDPLFISLSNNTYGERLKSISFRKIVKEKLREANIDSNRISTHSLRHTAITLALISGSTLVETRDMARHTDINTTADYFTNLQRVQNSPEAKIGKFIKENITSDIN
ncbi:MAG: hypothetical protein E7164_01155 [Firmicutes bacterium]|nr:hypothetical protein [Bacillota bacterium]